MVDVGTGANIDPATLLADVHYKNGWTFKIGGPARASVCVFVTTPDSNNPAADRRTQHMFRIPECDDARAFYRWLFSQLLLAEQHEAGEFFTVGDHRPFFPYHQDEGSPYELVERWEQS